MTITWSFDFAFPSLLPLRKAWPAARWLSCGGAVSSDVSSTTSGAPSGGSPPSPSDVSPGEGDGVSFDTSGEDDTETSGSAPDDVELPPLDAQAVSDP